MDYYWEGIINYCIDLMCELDEELKHQIEDLKEQNLIEITVRI